MSADDPSSRLEGLLSQHTWVRALARTLVRNDADADDLTQEAWLAAMRSPPTEPGSARGWFGTVLRNASRQAHRGESRRDRREDESARPEAQPSAHEIVARAEEHRRVVDAVLALEEPYRTTMLLRFFDDLPPRDVAARMDVPVETVRARVRRALERLRETLDAAHGGDGATWKLALLPLAGLHPEMVSAAAAAAKSAVAGAKAGAAPVAKSAVVTSAMTTGAITMGASATAVVGIVALAAGGAIVWLAGSGDRDALAKLRADLDTAKADVASSKSDAEKARADAKRKDEKIAELESKRTAAVQAEADAQARAAKAASELADVREEIAKLRPAATAAPKPKGPAIEFPQFAEALDNVDWKSVALHTTAIVGPIREIADAITSGKPVPLGAAGEAQKHNGPLIQAVAALRDKLSGYGPNGAYTHPAFMVNALVAALEQIGKPASPAQRTSLEDLGRRFTDEEAKRVASYDESTFQMRKLVEEGALKSRFFDEVRAVLTADQLDSISPVAVRDRSSADLWSEGLLWATVTRPVKIDRGTAFTDTVSRISASVLKLDDGQRSKAAAVVADWTSRLPESLAGRKPDALELNGMMPSDVIAIAAGETRKLVERLANDLSLSSDQLAAARTWGIVVYPLPGGGDE